jgi:hypothetical protein
LAEPVAWLDAVRRGDEAAAAAQAAGPAAARVALAREDELRVLVRVTVGLSTVVRLVQRRA